MQESARRHYLESMGIHVWRLRDAPENAADEPAATSTVEQTPDDSAESPTELYKLSVSDIEAWLARQCLMKIRAADASANTLGDPQSDLMILSQCLVQDKLTHQPFSGRSGVLLRNMLAAVDRQTGSVLIGELDTPHAEGKLLTGHLAGKPVKVVLLLVDLPDKDAAGALARFRQRECRVGDTSVRLVVSFHPDYLLKHPEAKALAWEDWCYAMKLLEAP